MTKQMMEEMRRIKKEFSFKLENKMFGLDSNYTEDHMEIFNTVSEHVQDCNDNVEKENMDRENVTKIIHALDARIMQLGKISEELESVLSNYGQNNNEDFQSKLRTLADKEKENVVRIDAFESRIDTLTDKVNHFVQNVMVVRSLPQKVMVMQMKLAEMEKKILNGIF